MNAAIRRYAAELATAPDLHRILGLVTSCRALCIDAPADVLIGLDDAIQASQAAIDRAIADAPADASDAAGDHRRDQDQPTDAEIDRAQERMEHLFGRDALMETENA